MLYRNDLPTSLSAEANTHFEIFPNPMSDQATVYFNEALTAQHRIELVDVSGRVVRS
ncbi:MAG: T9SS type A sorting domain-containing protein [Flavobacteriales bacterium]|nr:T9SS type A sorting domain-containing protein [Flavobacteriales bacterium]